MRTVPDGLLDKQGRIKNIQNTLLQLLSEDDILRAIKEFDTFDFSRSGFKQSSFYDLVHEGRRYPPKAILGLALINVTGYDIRYSHFTGGESSPCFAALRALGFRVEPKESVKFGLKRNLALHRTYTREELSQIFDPDAPFKVGSGKWGLHGIVRLEPDVNDYAFLVTLEEHDGNPYEDRITEDGVLHWKSQTRHDQNSSFISEMLCHDDKENKILLFVRSGGGEPYKFMGPLRFKYCDPTSNNPVHFEWEIIHWKPEYMRFFNQSNTNVTLVQSTEEKPKQTLKQVKPPKPSKPGLGGGNSNKSAIPPEKVLRQEENNRILGERGEELVLEYEKNKLREAGRSDLAEQVHHIALLDSSAGYDIVSFDEVTGDEIFIEVKTTKYARNRPFYISRNEVLKSEALGDSYKIYRVFGLNPDAEDTSEVEFYIKSGSVTEQFELTPTSYSASAKQDA